MYFFVPLHIQTEIIKASLYGRKGTTDIRSAFAWYLSFLTLIFGEGVPFAGYYSVPYSGFWQWECLSYEPFRGFIMDEVSAYSFLM
jgi:hypothetical protein